MNNTTSKAFSRHDFLIKDLVVSIGAGGRGGTFLPADDDKTPPTPISPIASVLYTIGYIEAVRGTIVDAVKAQKFDEVLRAFDGDPDGNPAIRTAINEIGRAVVASAAFAALGGGGTVGLPDPDCGGTSLETIPPTLTPIVHVGLAVHKVTELPRLKKQLAQTVAYLDKASAAQAPQGKEIAVVRAQLEGALKNLPQ
jgi:hypothetical protein